MPARAASILVKLGGFLVVLGMIGAFLIESRLVSLGRCTGALPGAIPNLAMETGSTFGLILFGIGRALRVLLRQAE